MASALDAQGSIPHMLFMAYQATFAIITAALISGAIVERMRFRPISRSSRCGSLVVYAPVAHWVWGGGWLASHRRARFRRRHRGPRQRRRRGAGRRTRRRPAAGLRPPGHPAAQRAVHAARRGPAVVRLVRVQRRQRARRRTAAALAFVNTLLAPAATLASWTLLDLRRGPAERRRSGQRPQSWSASSPITPAAGFVARSSAIASARSRRPELLRACCGGRARGSTIRSTSSPRMASAGPSARS